MSLLDRLARLLPDALSRRLARHGLPLAAGLALLILLSGVALAALVSPGTLGLSAARLSDTRSLPDALLGGALPERDADRDGLSDSLENYLYGSDAADWNTSGTGIPDGWLVEFGHDPLSPLVAQARGAAPPPDALPPAYARGYPIEFTPPLSAYYAFGRPADYEPGVDAPWWRGGAPRASPSEWDQGGTGIPTGWLLHYGLDPTGVKPDEPAPGAKGNLTLRQAFEHNADPRALDTDQDGLDDWTEVFSTRTDPARLSTAGTGMGDGWLLRFGLSPFDPDVASQDPDRDGLTNLEEFIFSADALRADVARDGPSAVWTKGLDPLDWQTAKTGIPDGWYVRYGLSPFGAEVDKVIGRALDFPEARDATSAPEGFEPLPDFVMTLKDAYSYGRPSTWDEATQGVWWGGTDPATLDTDGDGLPDPVEIRGWYANATFDVGPDAKPRVYKATSNPLEPDSDGDGLTDGEEYRGRVACDVGGTLRTRAFPYTDPRNRDTAFSGLSDLEKVCGIVRGQVRYDLHAEAPEPGAPTLDPTRADSAGDHLRDGPRVAYWHNRSEAYQDDPRYPFPGSAWKTVFEWTEKHARFAGMTPSEVLAQFRPDGDVDGDGIPNVLDADPSGGLVAAKEGPGTPKTKVYFPAGPEMDPSLYRFTEFASTTPRVASDPANPDTDGDGLPDAWEVRYGTFDPAKDGWDLDPAKADSDGDGVTDDKANNDGDVVTWYAYNRRGGGIERVTNTYPFDNLAEFVAGTHPGLVSTAGDGVPDGWKAFWGSRISDDTYPNLVSARDPRIGDVALERAGDVEAAMAQSPIQPLADLKASPSKATGYVRFATMPMGPDRSTDRCAGLLGGLTPHEVALRDSCFEGENLTGSALKVLPVEGVFTLGYADEARLRTNPFLADSDGDGAPDAYEAYFLQLVRGRTHPDPAVPDGARDADGDGLSLADECRPEPLAGLPACSRHTFLRDGVAYGAGADPHAADSDGDGIRDTIEDAAQLDLLDPSDLDGFRDPTRDADGDRVPDFQELTGWGKASFEVLLRTDPQSPDTDGDGLLDGPSIALHPATDAARIAAWKALGMAHTTAADGRVTFLGENTTYQATGSIPTKADSAGTGIPDAWFAYHLKDPREPGVDLAAYAVGRPSWWDEAKHGVWWWGRVPGADEPMVDQDGDGLHDLNGEDPFPANFSNAITRNGVTVTDMRDLKAFVDAGATPAEVKARAQMAGESAGDPNAARGKVRLNAARVPTAEDRARVAVSVTDAPSLVTKGVAFNVSGRVTLDERDGNGNLLLDAGVANRAVLVSMFGPDATKVVGAGFTDAQGRFNVTANLTTDLRVPIPQPGMVLLGATKGFATATFDPATVAAGATTAGVRNALVVWTTNTSATVAPGSPTYGDYPAMLRDADGQVALRTTHATRFAAAAPLPVTVRADTRLTTTLAEVAENGGRLVGDVRLTDASGGAIQEARVTLRWTGAPAAMEWTNFTDRTGRVNLTHLHIPVSVARADQYALFASFASSDPDLGSSNLSHPVAVRNPTTLAASLERAGATVGESVLLTGTLATRDVTLSNGAVVGGGPVPGEDVRVSLGGVDAVARTDDRGHFSVRVTVPGSLTAGAQTLVVRFPGADREGPSETTLPLAVKRTSDIVELTRVEGPRTSEATLRGRLVDNEGKGFLGHVEVYGGAVRLAAAPTDDQGRFALPLRLDVLGLGPQTLRVVYPGDLAHAATENLTQARVTSATTLRLDPVAPTLVRGHALVVSGVVLDDVGRPVTRQAVDVSWRHARALSVVTDDGGVFQASIPTNRSERPGPTEVAVTYTPPVNSIYRGAGASAPVAVLAGTTLEVGAGNATRGPVTLAGRLVDDEGRPVPGASVALTFGGVPLGEARTTRNGTFEATRVTPTSVPLGEAVFGARYEGTPLLQAADATATWGLRSPVLVQVTSLQPLVRGERAALEARVTDDRGAPLDATFTLDLAGHGLGTARAVAGRLSATLDVPADAPRGAAVLHLNATGTAQHEPTSHALPVVVKIRPKVDVALPALAVRGFAVSGDVTLTDDEGNPLRNTTFAYVLGKGASPVTGRTDAEGKAVVGSVAPVTGETFLALTVRGGPDVVAAEYRTPDLRVVGPATPVGYAALVVAALAVVGVIALVAVLAVIRRRQLGEARDILQEAIEELLAGNEYQATVFLAYRRFSAHLARHGYAEKAADTPREFAVGVRRAVPVGAAPLRSLIQVFEEARYSDHAIGTEERDRAVESLALVRNEIDALLGKKGGVAA